MSLTDEQKLAVAAAYGQASRTNDTVALSALSSPEAKTWHNFDDLEVDGTQTARTLGWLHRTVSDLAWTDRAILPTPQGFVWQSTMTGTAPGGALRVHTCVIVTLDADGLVVRAEEYLDPAQTAALRG